VKNANEGTVTEEATSKARIPLFVLGESLQNG
jgi:hypothetical protein